MLVMSSLWALPRFKGWRQCRAVAQGKQKGLEWGGGGGSVEMTAERVAGHEGTGGVGIAWR